MINIDIHSRNLVESLSGVLLKLPGIFERFYKQVEDRYKFNLAVKDNNICNFNGKNVYVKDVDNTAEFCFRPSYTVKNELHNILNILIREIKIVNRVLGYKNIKNKSIFAYNNQFYVKIDLPYECEFVKVMAMFDDKLIEVPGIGLSLDGLPYTAKDSDESQYSGWWISGKSVYLSLNNFRSKSKKINIKLYYENKGELK